jgi:hypothetical protein
MNLSSTARQVLTNLYNGLPMWRGTNQFSPGSGNPAVERVLRKHGLIDINNRITQAGRDLAEKGFK